MGGKMPSGSDTLGFCLSMENGEAVVLADTIHAFPTASRVFGTACIEAARSLAKPT